MKWGGGAVTPSNWRLDRGWTLITAFVSSTYSLRHHVPESPFVISCICLWGWRWCPLMSISWKRAVTKLRSVFKWYSVFCVFETNVYCIFRKIIEVVFRLRPLIIGVILKMPKRENFYLAFFTKWTHLGRWQSHIYADNVFIKNFEVFFCSFLFQNKKIS